MKLQSYVIATSSRATIIKVCPPSYLTLKPLGF